MHEQADSALGGAGNEIGSEELKEYLSVVGTHTGRLECMSRGPDTSLSLAGICTRSIDRDEKSAANGVQMRCN